MVLVLLVSYHENHWSKQQASIMTNDKKTLAKQQNAENFIFDHVLFASFTKVFALFFSSQGRLCYLMIYFHLWDQLNWIFIIRYLLRPKINSYKFCKNRCWHPDFLARVVLQNLLSPRSLSLTLI